MPAVRLLTPLFGHAAGTIVRDLPDGVARYITGQAWASWDLTGGTEQSAQTLPDDAPDNYGPEFAEFAERWRRVAGAAGVDGTLIDPATGALVNPVTAQPYLMPSVNGDVEIAIVLAGESKTLPSDGVVGYRLIVHDAIATGAVTIADDDGTYAIPVGSIGLFEFQSSGDVTLDNSSNTGGPITVLEIA